MANISKQHRDELLEKISKIREFIATSKADKNTRNLLQYLNEITKDIKGKKYGLVFEEHREAIDEKLDTHIPVLVEEKKLAIEGKNLVLLQELDYKKFKGIVKEWMKCAFYLGVIFSKSTVDHLSYFLGIEA